MSPSGSGPEHDGPRRLRVVPDQPPQPSNPHAPAAPHPPGTPEPDSAPAGPLGPPPSSALSYTAALAALGLHRTRVAGCAHGLLGLRHSDYQIDPTPAGATACSSTTPTPTGRAAVRGRRT